MKHIRVTNAIRITSSVDCANAKGIVPKQQASVLTYEFVYLVGAQFGILNFT
jgi:hypothetical protein